MEKKKWYCSAAAKGIWLAVVHIGFALICTLGVLLASFIVQGIDPLDLTTHYTDSEEFASGVGAAAFDIVEDLSSSLDMETHGEDIIDLTELAAKRTQSMEPENYSEAPTLTFQNTSGIAYRVSDLKKWASKGITYDKTTRVICTKPDGTYEYMTLDELQALFSNKKLTMTVNSLEGDFEDMDQSEIEHLVWIYLFDEILEDGTKDMGITGIIDSGKNTVYTDIRNYSSSALVEEFPPVDADSLWDVINEKAEWNKQPEEAFGLLETVLEHYVSANNSSTIKRDCDEGRSNLTYLLADRTHSKLYSNYDEYTNFSDLDDYFDQLTTGRYIYVDSQDTNGITNLNLKGTALSYYSNDQEALFYGTSAAYMFLKEKIGSSLSLGNDFLFVLKVDTDFPVSDSFAEASRSFENSSRLSSKILFGFCISVVLTLIGLIWLTVTAGRNGGDKELHLIAFDHWFTEISAALVFVIWACGLAGFLSYCDVYHYEIGFRHILDDTHHIILACILFGIFSAILFLTGYLSLVRRIKAKTLWSQSLLHRLLKLLGRFWKFLASTCKKLIHFYSTHTGSRLKATAALIAFCIFQLLFSAFTVDGNTFAFLMLLLADAAVLVYFIRRASGREQILNGLKQISEGELTWKIPTDFLKGDQKTEADYINNIGAGLDAAVESSLKNERMKAELITNVSHDIKTPLTSIINYVDLMKREEITDPKLRGYLDVLDEKSQRLKILTEDIVEASKASTGNLTLEMTNLNFTELLQQVLGEFEERFQQNHLTLMVQFDEKPAIIRADGQRLWRVLENIFTNVAKYAMEGTRVYAEIHGADGNVIFTLKNISAQPLNISADELTERFIRGDVSRNTEGSGLGLSIAKSLTELQKGQFELHLDGDLFKVTITFPAVPA